MYRSRRTNTNAHHKKAVIKFTRKTFLVIKLPKKRMVFQTLQSLNLFNANKTKVKTKICIRNAMIFFPSLNKFF